MRPTLILISLLYTLSVSGQIDGQKHNLTQDSVFMQRESNIEIDSLPNVVYKDTKKDYKQPLYYINGKIVNSTIFHTLNPKLIDNINIEKNEIEINGVKYYGQIFIKLKNNYCPKLISLTDLKSKYINPSNKPVIFMINNDIINDNYKNSMVDENYILKIVVTDLENRDNNLNIEIIRLITKTEENIKKDKEIRIRGINEIAID